ncbi:TPA: restriction endonuclease subunit S [Vibrio cholerae]|uniref:restriction endonuclease subunit S n=1 Tax=Vibrio cholerae TaxID=666 RepID=UPI001E2BFC3F|nr:restriction endonuclease subunit S [Vibrio cholerae]MCD6723079.1 restriction endonuclease subunit S [Vibrio cholerae]HDZ9226466.1 restriction endonuclease subunit S [Vibrio cholerae]
MYRVRVLQEIDDRLDAEYYNPAALSTLKKMENKGTVTTFGSLVNEGYRVVYHGTDSINGLKDSELLPFLSPTQIDPNGAISFDDADKLPLYYKERYPKGLAKVGEILVEVKGNVSKVGIVPLDFPKNLMISGSLYKATLDPKRADSHYVLAFLKSRHGQILKNRLTSNTIINYIAKEALYSIPIIEFGEKAQKYIGDKVRQAEQLRAWAKRCRGKINDYFDGLFTGISLTKPEHHHTRVSLDILVPRLNAEYYSDHYTQVEKGLLDRFGKLTTLGRLAATVRAKIKPSADCIYKEIGDLDVGKGAFSSGTFYKYGEAPNNAQRVFDEGDVAVSTRRPNRGAVAVIEESSSTTFYSVFLARLKPKNKNFGYWLKEFLRHDAGKLLLLQRCTWTTYPVISEDDIETIPVPEIPNDWDFVARLSRQSVELEAFATNLTTSAKTLVEALIEGQLTEQQLIQAQQALDDGDNSLDQAILSKLSIEGYGIEGATPLFSDIDELYGLLEGAAQAEAEE